ncbi:MAG TPA: transglycosylase SLT domain-containing protein [Methanosarcina sp.]|nr:transglycosylase SLT domain-containing protein [Methanosarcina sp.]
MHRIRRCALALLTALVCVLPTYSRANASQDPLLDFIKVVAPDAVPNTANDTSAESSTAQSVTSDNTAADTSREESATLPGDDDLAYAIAKRWGRDPSLIKQILGYVEQSSYDDFPTAKHILSIMAVESSFNPKAKNRGNSGLMQINLKANGKKLRSRSIEENIRVGADLLHEYYLLLRCNQRGTVLSYNAGIGNYLKGRYKTDYWRKYQRELSWFNAKQ